MSEEATVYNAFRAMLRAEGIDTAEIEDIIASVSVVEIPATGTNYYAYAIPLSMAKPTWIKRLRRFWARIWR